MTALHERTQRIKTEDIEQVLKEIVDADIQIHEESHSSEPMLGNYVVIGGAEKTTVVQYGAATQEIIEGIISHRRHVTVPKTKKQKKNA